MDVSSHEEPEAMEVTQLIALVDEDGNEMTFQFHSQIDIGNKRYAVLTPEDEGEEGLVILRLERDPVTGLDDLVDVEDEDEFERAALTADAALHGQRYCHGCGCTDDNACAGGCSWASETHCSQCVSAHE